MSDLINSELDLTLSRVIKAPRTALWQAWTDPQRFEKWWVPEPALCRVVAMELRPGGAFTTAISENGDAFGPHINGCFLAVEPEERIVFTNSLVAGWRPAEEPFMTAIITLRDHPEGSKYVAHVMHRNNADKTMHAEMGFYDGWGTVAGQLARLVEV